MVVGVDRTFESWDGTSGAVSVTSGEAVCQLGGEGCQDAAGKIWGVARREEDFSGVGRVLTPRERWEWPIIEAEGMPPPSAASRR